MIQLAFFHTFLLLVDDGIFDPLTIADDLFPSATATYSTGSEM